LSVKHLRLIWSYIFAMGAINLSSLALHPLEGETPWRNLVSRLPAPDSCGKFYLPESLSWFYTPRALSQDGGVEAACLFCCTIRCIQKHLEIHLAPPLHQEAMPLLPTQNLHLWYRYLTEVKCWARRKKEKNPHTPNKPLWLPNFLTKEVSRGIFK